MAAGRVGMQALTASDAAVQAGQIRFRARFIDEDPTFGRNTP
jgi:hypothetical protein